MAKDRFDIKEKESVTLMTETMIIVDKETGVNYLYVGRQFGGGLRASGAGHNERLLRVGEEEVPERPDVCGHDFIDKMRKECSVVCH